MDTLETARAFLEMNQVGPLAAIKPNSRSQIAQCPDCGRQFEQVVFIRPDNSEVAPDPRCDECSEAHDANQRRLAHAQELEMVKGQRRQEWLAALNQELGEKFHESTFGNFDKAKQPAAFKVMQSWDGQSLVLASPPGIYGVGKTHLCAALAHKLVDSLDSAVSIHGSVVRLPRPVLFTSEPMLMDRIRATFHDDSAECDEAIYAQLENVRLLIIDDVGKRQPRDLNFTQQVWYRIIDGRYRKQKPVVLTTNLLPVDMEQHIGGAPADRLTEMVGPKGFIAMKGESYRRRA
jgi:DNA replication protein DnaC